MELKPFNLPSGLDAESFVNGNHFHGTTQAKHVISSEEPWHRAAALMFARGAVTKKEVAEAFGVDPGTIRNLLRQPWFQENVTRLMAESGAKDIMELFRAEQFNSLITLTEIRDDEKAPKVARVSCARDILDRSLGKPVQRIEQSPVPTSSDPVAEVQRLEEANNRLRSQPTA